MFVRSVELQLAEYGFDIPSRRYFGEDHVINKYNPFAVQQEIQWALDPGKKPPMPNRLLRVGDDAYLDPYMHPCKPRSKAGCLEAMDLSERFFSEVRGCPYFLIALCAVEVWYDRETRNHVNWLFDLAKFDALRAEVAARFLFRVPTYDEVYKAIHETLVLLREASPACRVILALVPGDPGVTFAGKDILCAATYSKSVLRVAAEEVCARFSWVDYVPVYESFAFMPHEKAWDRDGDGAHALDSCIALQVDRMVEQYSART